jgi:hypothetical protein
MAFPRSVAAAAIGVILMIVGSFGPWAKVLGTVTINGTDSGKDGWVTLVCGIIAAVFLLIVALARLRWLAIGALLAGLVAAATAAYDITDINRLGNGSVASTQWGIYLALIGSIIVVLASIWAIAEVRNPAAEQAPAPAAPPTHPPTS